MAQITTTVNEQVYQIRRFLGVNEAPDGDSRLKDGEAAEMRNFCVTAGGALKKRPGCRTVAGMVSAYTLTDSEESFVRLTEAGAPQAELDLYPTAAADSAGNIELTGVPVQADADTADSYAGWYASVDGAVRKLDGVTATARSQTAERACKFSQHQAGAYHTAWFCCYSSLIWNGSAFAGTDPVIKGFGLASDYSQPAEEPAVGDWVVMTGPEGTPVSIWDGSGLTEADFQARYSASCRVGRITGVTPGGMSNTGVWSVTYTCAVYKEAVYSWRFFDVTAEPNTPDTEVRALWSGFVAGREVICAACNGHLWELRQTDSGWTKISAGSIDTTGTVALFGFNDRLYIIDGQDYRCWDGTSLTPVAGYVPLVVTAAQPSGGGTALEQVNKLTASRRARFSADGTATVYQLPETGLESIDRVTVGGVVRQDYTADPDAGTVTFTGTAPDEGVNNVEVLYTASGDDRSAVTAMRFAELYNGLNDNRVFLYGDGSATALYSGLDENGLSTAEYFPDLNVMRVGGENEPVTAMIRHYNKLLAFKENAAYSIYYSSMTLSDGNVTAGFFLSPVNRSIGNCAPGQAVLVENRPRTLDGRSVYEWASAGGNVTGDERNAKRISQRVDRSIRALDLTAVKAYYDKTAHEYYLFTGGTALVHNTEADAWYRYTDFPAACMISYRDEVYLGTEDGRLLHFSHDWFSDDGEPIDAYWESGSMPFGADFKRKYSAMLWVGIKPEDHGYLEVSAETDKKTDFAVYSFSADDGERLPQMHRIKLKAKKFTFYKLLLRTDTADSTATVVSADIRIRATGYVR